MSTQTKITKTQKTAKPAKPAKMDPHERLDALTAAKKSSHYKAGLKHIGSTITFTPSRGGAKPVTGVIKNLSLSKDLSRTYFSVLNEKSKKRYCCAVLNDTIKFK